MTAAARSALMPESAISHSAALAPLINAGTEGYATHSVQADRLSELLADLGREARYSPVAASLVAYSGTSRNPTRSLPVGARAARSPPKAAATRSPRGRRPASASQCDNTGSQVHVSSSGG